MGHLREDLLNAAIKLRNIQRHAKRERIENPKGLDAARRSAIGLAKKVYISSEADTETLRLAFLLLCMDSHEEVTSNFSRWEASDLNHKIDLHIDHMNNQVLLFDMETT